MNNRRRVAFRFLGIALCSLLFCSCISFDIGDWPSRYVYPHNDPPANWCGRGGAFCAYYLLYYIGPGVFVILAGGIVRVSSPVARRSSLERRDTRDETRETGDGTRWFRAIGLFLLTVAASASFYLFWPYRVYSFPMGSGGVLGVALVVFLQTHFALLGSFILLLATWIVGIILVAEPLILAVVSGIGYLFSRIFGTVAAEWSAAKHRSQVLTEIWRKLSRAPTQPALRESRISNFEIRNSDIPPKAQQDYTLPPLELLDQPQYCFAAVQEKVVAAKANTLEKLLSEFNVNARVVAVDTGPVVTMFELELAAGVKVSAISTLSNDMARALGVGAVRVVAPLPGKHTIGIEVPNTEKEKVRMKDMINLAGSAPETMHIPIFLGKDSSGAPLVADLTTMPHLLIAGTTGSGKSICINSIITGILLTKRPDEVKLILIDPKMVEMTNFNMIPHLMCPIVTETAQAVKILEWATVKMDERYALLAEARVKNVAQYNKLSEEQIIKRFSPATDEEAAKIERKLPYIVIIIDELADLMMTAAKDIEGFIVRLAQKSRSIGIHLVLATQRPQATVVTGLIKSNMPTRIGFRVAAKMDSRIILDQNGAETLLGEGDMLFLKPGTSDLVRAQGTFVDEAEVKRIVKFLKAKASPQFSPELTSLKKVDVSEMRRDELFDEAVRIVLETQRGSVSLLQRRLNIGYARASRMIEMMAAIGILGEYKGSQAREVMMTIEQYEQRRGSLVAPGEIRPATSWKSEIRISKSETNSKF